MDRTNVGTDNSLPPILLRISPDVTALTRMGRSRLYEEIAAGRLPVVRIGRSVRVRRADLDRWIDQHATGSVTAGPGQRGGAEATA